MLTGIHATGGDSEASPVSEMSPEQACSLLQVTSNAGFEEVLQAKKRLLVDVQADSQKAREVTALHCVQSSRQVTGKDAEYGCNRHGSCLARMCSLTVMTAIKQQPLSQFGSSVWH